MIDPTVIPLLQAEIVDVFLNICIWPFSIGLVFHYL